MSELGKRLINAASSAQAIAKGEADPQNLRGACTSQYRRGGNSYQTQNKSECIRRPLRHLAIHIARLGTESTRSGPVWASRRIAAQEKKNKTPSGMILRRELGVGNPILRHHAEYDKVDAESVRWMRPSS